MSTITVGHEKTFASAGDYSAKQYFIVKLSAQGVVTLASAATDFIIGAITNKPAAATGANVSVSMRHGGATGKVILGGTVTLGDNITANSAGKAITTTTAADECLGRALQSGVAGDIIEYTPLTNKYAVT